MDANRFDNLARSLIGATSRRSVLRGIVIATLGQAVHFELGVTAGEARKKGKNRKKKFKKNTFECVDVGNKCFGRDEKCCSGICDGQGKRSKCAAHNEGGCSADDSSCPESIPCGVGGECYRTTGKAGFCAAAGLCDCHPCTKDKDCEPEFGEGAACIVCITDTENTCVDVNGSKGTACVPPAPLP